MRPAASAGRRSETSPGYLLERSPAGWARFVGLIVFWLGANLINDPSEFFNVAFIGLTNGCVYALVALGYTLVYGILQLINFARRRVRARRARRVSVIVSGSASRPTTRRQRSRSGSRSPS